MKITITGMPGSGKSTVGKILAEKLKMSFMSIGEMRRAVAKIRGMTIFEYNKLNEDTDTPVDKYQEDFGKQNDNIIVEGRTSFHFIPDSVKVFLGADINVAAERIFKDPRNTEKKYNNVEEVEAAIKDRMENDGKRYKERYGFDAFDRKNFDIVIDTTSISAEEVAEEIILKLQK
ncbi:MAG: (d)CMP kinase [Candidatus Woesearchaeota archaeon]